ncbi:McrBC 5-methylcytosine restriction system component [Sporichthya brevicatena]|uniref:McrBC 5-methylcytosine restriction system component n=1 Tax=Sporichthya brevicatena TaxID=171442 RepID=A0ABN1H411_9ACTN
MTTVCLSAWSSAEATGIDAAQARALTETKAVTLTPGWAPGTWTVTASSYVGVLHVAGVEVRIRPRISVARLMFLLGYAQDPRIWRDDPVGLEHQPDLWPAMAQVFVRQAEKALERGLLQGYRVEESAQLVMRGRLREADQLRRRAGLAVPLEVRYDEYDADIAENRLLRTAAERLIRVPRLPAPAVRRLRTLVGHLAEVSRLVPGQPLPPTPPSRLNARYLPALTLARMVLRARSVDVRDRGVHASGFLVNMNAVFEDFVTVALTEALARHGGRCVPQDVAHPLDVARRIAVQPDLVRYGPDGRPQAVVDAKYKSESPSGYPYADVYQLLAYCTALNVPVGHLVYAEGGSAPDDVVVRNVSVTIRRHALDLARPVPELLAQVTDIADAVAGDG